MVILPPLLVPEKERSKGFCNFSPAVVAAPVAASLVVAADIVEPRCFRTLVVLAADRRTGKGDELMLSLGIGAKQPISLHQTSAAHQLCAPALTRFNAAGCSVMGETDDE